MKIPTEVIASAVRIEHNTDTGDLYIVFKVESELLRKQIIDDWTQDLELKLTGRNLKYKE